MNCAKPNNNIGGDKMKNKIVGLLMIFMLIGTASAYDNIDQDYVLQSEQLDESVDTITPEIYHEFEGLSDEYVAVKFYDDGSEVYLTDEFQLESGESEYLLDEAIEFDQVELYTEADAHSEVDSYTIAYDYDGADTSDIENYQEVQTFDELTLTESQGMIMQVLSFVIVMFIVIYLFREI